MKANAIKTAAQYFPSYPSVNEFHVTEDSQVFHTKNDATNHARSIKPKTVKDEVVHTVTREEAENFIKDASKVEAEISKEKEEKIAAATERVTTAQAALAEKETALEVAKGPKKEAAQQEVEEAKNELSAATTELEGLSESK